MAVGGVARGDSAQFELDNVRLFPFGAEGCGDGAQRADPFKTPCPPTHGLAPGEGLDRCGQNVAQNLDGGGALFLDHCDVEIAFFFVGLDRCLIDARQPGGAQEAIERLLGGADLGALALFARVGGSCGKARYRKRQAARRGECAGAFIDKTFFDQSIGYGLLEVLGGPALEARGNFLGKELKQQFGHSRGALGGSLGMLAKR